MAVLGVDGWRGRWAGALLDGRAVRLLELADVAAVLAVPGAEVVAIDMPIGLSEDGVRACDLVPAIRQLDGALGDPPDRRVVEVHPELAFRELDARPRDPKTSARGAAQRLRALEPAMDVLDALAGAPDGLPLVGALDACAAAWSAARVAAGSARCVGDGRVDARGRVMRTCW